MTSPLASYCSRDASSCASSVRAAPSSAPSSPRATSSSLRSPSVPFAPAGASETFASSPSASSPAASDFRLLSSRRCCCFRRSSSRHRAMSSSSARSFSAAAAARFAAALARASSSASKKPSRSRLPLSKSRAFVAAARFGRAVPPELTTALADGGVGTSTPFVEAGTAPGMLPEGDSPGAAASGSADITRRLGEARASSRRRAVASTRGAERHLSRGKSAKGATPCPSESRALDPLRRPRSLHEARRAERTAEAI
mmetsp:Transcript_14931/g.63021  ORF Transcript_14931/g.63021 Transcript_14931/m.63021 type:complete len:256 (+) Transcript_14931:411-1178(+)